MFMLRCVFWLSVMFASLPAVPGVVGAWRGADDGAVAKVAAVDLGPVGTWCSAQAAQCTRDAGRLAALVAATARLDPALDDDRIGPAGDLQASARRHVVKYVLTEGR